MPRPVSNLRDSSKNFELLLRCLRFPELCPVTVRLPEIFATRRQAAVLIPSALLTCRSPVDPHPHIYNSGGLQTLTHILNTISPKKSSHIFHKFFLKHMGSPIFFGRFPNFSRKKLDAFPLFILNWEIFIVYIDTLLPFMLNFYQCFTAFYTIQSCLSIVEKCKAAGKSCGFLAGICGNRTHPGGY